VRVVPEPPTEYLRFGLWLAQFNAGAGEDVRYLTRDQANRLDLPAHDFWVLDAERLALLYSPQTIGCWAWNSSPTPSWGRGTSGGWSRPTPSASATATTWPPIQGETSRGADRCEPTEFLGHDRAADQVRGVLGGMLDDASTVMAERIGWAPSLTVLKERVESCGRYPSAGPELRTACAAGLVAQCDPWVPRTSRPVAGKPG
jgi:hypothetical protein